MMQRKPFIESFSVEVLQAPLKQTFRIAYGQHDNLKNVFFSLKLSDGTKGYGEAAVASHITGETIPETVENLRVAGRRLIGVAISDYYASAASLAGQFSKNKAGLAALEMALMDALARVCKKPLWKFFGTRAHRLTTDITIVISDLGETEHTAKEFYRRGFRIFKVKVGRDPDLDLRRMLAVKKVAPKAKIYLDANQGFSADGALGFLKSLAKYDIHPLLIEQPVAKKDWDGLKKVTRLSKVPVCADESAASPEDVLRIIRERCAHVINIKLVKFGFLKAQEMAVLSRVKGFKLMIGSMMESPLSATAAAHLAAGLGEFDYIDLDTPFFIKGLLAKNPFLNSRGVYDLTSVKAGIGIVPPAQQNKR